MPRRSLFLRISDPGGTTTGGTRQQIWDCNGQSNQTWMHTSSGRLSPSLADSVCCLDANGAGISPGTNAIIWPCNGGSKRQWSLS